MTLEQKVDHAINLLKNIPKDGAVEIAYSGGKDSDVILELAKLSGIEYRAIYHQTTIDPPGTTLHCKNNGVEIIRPGVTFFSLIEKHGPPTRRARYCCSYLKEYKTLDRAIWGIRRSESIDRGKRYFEPEICRVYKNGQKARVYLPLLEWDDNDLESFIRSRGIKCHPLYYDSLGNFHVERRLGCIGCPMSRSGMIKDFKQYPKMLNLWIRSTQRYLDSHPNVSSVNKFKDAFHLMYHNIFCSSYRDYLQRITMPVYPVGVEDLSEWRERYFCKNWKQGCGVDLNVKRYLSDYFGLNFEVNQIKK